MQKSTPTKDFPQIFKSILIFSSLHNACGNSATYLLVWYYTLRAQLLSHSTSAGESWILSTFLEYIESRPVNAVLTQNAPTHAYYYDDHRSPSPPLPRFECRTQSEDTLYGHAGEKSLQTIGSQRDFIQLPASSSVPRRFGGRDIYFPLLMEPKRNANDKKGQIQKLSTLIKCFGHLFADEFRSKVACENDVIQLVCNPYSRIAVYSASYGRTEYESIQCAQPLGVKEESELCCPLKVL